MALIQLLLTVRKAVRPSIGGSLPSQVDTGPRDTGTNSPAKRHHMANFIGIDLGTSFSAVAFLDENGKPTIVYNRDGQNTTPSCVMVEGESASVGEDARRQWGVDPENVAARFKRDMGTDRHYVLNARSFSSTDLSALVLEKIKADTEAAIGPITEAVVTIPANFTHEAREATLAAARTAGLSVQYIINEPTAAALYYAYKLGRELSGTYAVYDLGGGTFDVSIIAVSGQETQVITSQGISRLGGDDFDKAIQQLVARKYEAQTGHPLAAGSFTRNDAEECKKSLSKRETIQARAALESIEIARHEFESEISLYLAQTEMLCEAALDEAGVTANDIKGVFLVGGSTRIPAVQASIERVFKQTPTSQVNVDEVVALGAALYTAYKSGGKQLSMPQRSVVNAIQLGEVTNFCFGTSVLMPEAFSSGKVLKNEILIRKNEKIPCSVTKTFYTVRHGQELIDCDVTQSVGAETDPRFVKALWKGSLPLPPGRPTNQPIQITFGFDSNNVMSCRFVDVVTGRDIAVDLSPGGDSGRGQTSRKIFVE